MRVFVLVCFALSLMLIQQNVSAIDAAQEYDIKATYVMNLGNFVTWPESVLAESDKPFNVCTLGDDPFAGALEFLVTKHDTVKGHPVTIQHLNAVQDTFNCHVLFIAKTEFSDLDKILQQLKRKPILLVSDLEHFVIRGGMVQFFQRNNKVRLMLDPETFTEANLQPNANLLRIAKLVSNKE